MQEYEVLKPLEVTDESSPLFGTHDAGATLTVDPANGVLESIAEFVEQGFLKFIKVIEEAAQTTAVAQTDQTAQTQTAASDVSSETQTTEQATAGTAPVAAAVSTNAADITAALQAKFATPPAPFEAVPPMLYAFCKAIEEHEVFAAPGENPKYPQGTRAYFDKNPGNLKYRGQVGSIGEDKDSFAIFPDFATGFMALVRQVELAISGKSAAYKNPVWDATEKAWRHINFLDFFKIYDSSYGDDPVAYAKDVAASMSAVAGVEVSVETVINQLV